MKVKFGLRPKIFIIFLSFMVILSEVTSYVTKRSYESTIIDTYYQQAISIATLASSVLDGERIKGYVESGKETQAYQAELERLNNIKQQTGAYYLYVMYPIGEGKGVYVFDAKLTQEQIKLIGEKESALGDEVVFGNDFPSAMEVLATGKPSSKLDITTTIQGDAEQTLASAYAPIFDNQKNVIAFVGVDVNMTDVNRHIQEVSFQVIQIIAAITLLCFVVLLVIIQISIVWPVKKLKKAAENLADRKFGEPIHVYGSDEISEITRVFNRMAVNIQSHMTEINTINEAYHKYVPSLFFQLLQKESVTDTELGSQKQRELAILNFNVIGFVNMIRQMNSEEMFSFINTILQHALPDVIQEEGMVETFHEGGFTALYSDTCKAALSTAVSISQKINLLNAEKRFGEEPLKFGIGIAYGSVMLGIVGYDSRLSAISISNQTEIAEFLQKLAPKYNANILITGTAAAQITDFSRIYHARVIGYLFNTFTNQMEKIYDVYDGDNEEDRRRKEMTRPLFEQGVRLYCARKFYEARNAFVEVLKQFRKDTAAREYLFLCNQHYQKENVADVDIWIERF